LARIKFLSLSGGLRLGKGMGKCRGFERGGGGMGGTKLLKEGL
jgi:hypothetical protein